jgi:hypothetical protein
MNWVFRDRIVTKIGTVYSHYIGNSRDTTVEMMDKISVEAKALKGILITIDGVTSRVIDVEVTQRCNLTEMNYYVNILTDEEKVEPQ